MTRPADLSPRGLESGVPEPAMAATNYRQAEFDTGFMEAIVRGLGNDFQDNWDEVRFGPEKRKPPLRGLNRLRGVVVRRLAKWGFLRSNRVVNALIAAAPIADEGRYLYGRLERDEDRLLLIQILAFRALGHRMIRLPLSTPAYRDMVFKFRQLGDLKEEIDTGFLDFRLRKVRLDSLGFPIQLFGHELGFTATFGVKQYEYSGGGITIGPVPGDVVIDGGACWGDTTLYFANEVGNSGHIFAFEFEPENLVVLNRNLELNGSLRDRVTVVNAPLWDRDGVALRMEKNGPATHVVEARGDGEEPCLATESIDSLVESGRVGRVDFIKLDVEGAESRILSGARNALVRFRPKLAISLYHHLEDFDQIPRLLDSIAPGYKFFLKHATLHAEETILFCMT